jgi:tetratricopeptide (TPR) repeat protein
MVMTMTNPLPPSRLLARLDADIAAERHPLRADILRAERAAYLARQGQTDEARKELAALHQRHDGRPDFEMSAWLSLAESLVSYLSDMGPVAPDKMRRARALSQAVGLTKLHALSSAWLAQMDYNRFEIDLMVQHVGESLKLAANDYHSARSRASLVVGQALHLSGHMDLAAPWYKRARDHAVADGDEATTSAIMHNMSWLRMHTRRQEKLTGTPAGMAGSHALLGVDSTVQYDHLQGISSLESLKPILRAHVLTLEGRADQALALFEEYASAQPEGMSRLQCTMLSDRAWCLVEIGRIDDARVAAIEAESSFQQETQIDDRAATHSRLAQVFAATGDIESAERHKLLAANAWDEFVQLQSKICGLLRNMSEFGPT